MDRIWLTCSLCCLLLVLLCSSAKACIRDSDCDGGRHCCKSHCTSSKLNCNEICFDDRECSRDHLCTQNMCVACSKRYNCELKSCYNDTDCPTSLRCSSNHMCTTRKPPKQSFTLLPFIIIISVLGFALLVLCYTEGCWKEILIYLKRYFGRYGRIARDEHEADQRDLCESERGSHVHSNKSCVDPRRIAVTMTNHTQSEHNNLQANRTNSNSPNTLRNTRVITHDSETRTMTVAESSRPSRSRSPLVTSCTSSTCQQDPRVPNSVNSDFLPALSNPHTRTRNPSPLPPNYCSLFKEEEDEFEEPPPKYDDVINNMNAIPICIEMQPIRRGPLTATSHSQNTETTV